MVKQMALKGIVFDLDGTLIDSLSTTFDSFNHAITQFGGRKHSPHEILKLFGPGEGEIFSRILGAEKAEAAYECARSYMNQNVHRVPLHQGIPELLEKLRDQLVPISIFTGRSWKTTEIILKHHGLLERFVSVVTDDHVSLPKPSPEGLYMALSKMGLSPQEVLFVGDSSVDMHAAYAAGSHGVAALWDLLAKKENLESANPRFWAATPTEVWRIWDKNR